MLFFVMAGKNSESAEYIQNRKLEITMLRESIQVPYFQKMGVNAC